jgi:glutamate--cysteine ligase
MNYTISTKDQLDNFACCRWNEINAYIDQMMANLPVPLTSSVDIREGREKYAPVDHNMYPAGFNNVCALDLDAGSRTFAQEIKKLVPEAKRIAIIPESNTKNVFYLDHLAILGKTIRDAGYEVLFVSLDPELFATESTPLSLLSFSKYDVAIHKGSIKDGKLTAAGESIDLAILNHDQSNPLPVDWNSLSTPVAPTPKIGWFVRQKNTHFAFYKKVADEFCAHFSINPDLIQAKFRAVEDVDFAEKGGLEKLADEVETLKKDIPEGASVFIKGSQGTYGMGIMVVKSGEEILSMNRRDRNKMDIGKNKIKFTKVLVQEGVETVLKYEDMPAEVTIYLVGGKAMGGFMRANSERDSVSNLNAKGMVFRKYCISEIKQNNDFQCKEAIYSVIARLSTLAGALEISEVL